MAEKTEPDFHLGRLIRQELQRQKRTVSWLAETINCDRTNIYCIFSRQYIDIELLKRISKALQHNFFTDLADYMQNIEKVSTKV